MSLNAGISALIANTALAGAMMAATLSAAPVFAQDTATTETEPAENDAIVVTAQKRNEAAQDVPVSLFAFGAKDLDTANVVTLADLQRIAPTFKSTSSIGTLATRFSIRGVGTFGNSAIEPSVATFIDGIYIPRPASIINSLLDISAVEVLSGPQGTLFGRNASAGAVSYRTNDPGKDFGGILKADYSTGDRIRAEGAINLPVSDTVAIRVAGLVDDFDGFWTDSVSGRKFGGMDTYAGRVSIKADLGAVTWTVRGEYQKNEGDGTANTSLVPATLTPDTIARLTAVQGGIAPDLNPFDRRNAQFVGNNRINDSMAIVSSDLSYETDGGFTFRLLNGYTRWKSDQSDGDTAALANYVLGRDLDYNSESHSHELQFISPKGMLDGKLDFVGGLYYYHEDLGIRQDSINGTDFCSVVIPRINPAAFPGLAGTDNASRIAACRTYTGPSTRGDFTQSTRSVAIYGQATFEIVPAFSFTGGLRYTDEKKLGNYVGTVYNPTGFILAANETSNLSLKENKLTWRANLAWRPTGDIMIFATASTGFKSGGLNNGIATVDLGQQRIFAAETIHNYEFGLKSQLLDRKLTFNATAFRMDIDNFQERSIVNTTSTIRNVGKVRNQGLELELVARPSRDMKVNFGVAYLDSNIRQYCNAPRPPYLPAIPAPAATANCPTLSANTQDLSGKRLNYTPEWTITGGAEVGGDLGSSGMRWRLNGDVNLVSDQLTGTTIDNSELTRQDGYVLLGARLTLSGADDRWSLSAFGRNLTNAGYCNAKVYQVLEGPLGMRFDNDSLPGNDATAVRCLVAAPRTYGVSGTVRF
ncbi:TonB-dependent receptor [Novosphingobium sp.]|uniref:TonB-dependent receptor n=1 Tax=Novosphingobium sp. TaxID=1874826 RepID=UPI002619C509|nr:TonB-dependent receptor [Novosphingobium sp.]